MCFIVVGLFLPYSNTPMLKAWGGTSRAQRLLTTGIVRRQFLSLRGTPGDVTMGWVRETALASSTYASITWRLLTFTGWNWTCHVIIVIKTNLSGLTPSGFHFLFRARPRALGQPTPTPTPTPKKYKVAFDTYNCPCLFYIQMLAISTRIAQRCQHRVRCLLILLKHGK